MKIFLLGAAALALAACVHEPGRDAPRAAASASPVQRVVDGTRRTVLPNGLTVLTREQRGSGVVAVDTWVKAGYFHEPDEVAGMAHLFEHMFFKGSRAFPGPSDIARAVTGAGGTTNASTIYDHTNYYIVVPRERLARAVEIQADAIAHPRFDPQELRKEAEVVIEESNRKLDNAPAVAHERMLATAFTRHRVKRWRIGSDAVLRAIRRDDLVAFFETLYRPENLVVTVAGDATHEEALAAVREHFGPIPRGTPRKSRGPQEPPQERMRFGRSEADLQQGQSVMGWHTVPAGHADEMALEVLAQVLGGGRSSRLHALVGPQGAMSLAAAHDTYEDVGWFSVQGAVAEGNRRALEANVIAEVERMKAHGPTAYELAAAKHAIAAAQRRMLETALGQARALARAESRGGFADLAREAAQVEALDAARVREVARRYLRTEGLTLYHYQPRGAAAIDEALALAQVREAAARPVAAAPVELPLPDPRSRMGLARADSPPEQIRLSNGARLVVQQRTGAATVAAGVWFRGGRAEESVANAGITRLMLSAMRRGTTARDGEALDRELEFLGSRMATVNLDDGFGVTLDAAPGTFEPALALVAEMLTAPAFGPAGVAREKGLLLAAQRRDLDSSTERPAQLFRAALYGDHPYGLPEHGTPASVGALEGDALRAWWRRSVAADRATVVVVGPLDAQDVRAALEEKLRGLAPAGAPRAPLPPVPALATVREAIDARDRRQTAFIVGYPAVAAGHPDFAALRLLQAVTSGLSGTFGEELRGRQSLAYTVRVTAEGLAQAGAFVGYLACAAGKEPAARAAMLAQMRSLREAGPAEADVERARAALGGATRIGRESPAALALEYGRSAVLGLPLDHVDRLLAALPGLSAADLKAAAARHAGGEAYVYAALRGRAAP